MFFLFLIRNLPKTGMESMNDRVICVPIPDEDVIKSVTCLPRTSANDGYITVNLKRMKSLKKNEMQETVLPNQLLDGLEYLRLNHQDYKDIVPNEIIEEFMENDESNDKIEVQNDDKSDIPNDVNQDKSEKEVDSDDEEKEDVFNKITCLLPENPQAKVLVNDTEKTIKKKMKIASEITHVIAPGECKTPTNYMRDPRFLETAFPRHFPDGKYGLFCDRPKKLTPQQYFNQRLLNHDKRFAKDYGFLFVAQQYTERHAIERNISISMKKGKFVNGADGGQIVQPNDKFNVLKTVRGTPAYWQTLRYEIFAKLEQLGPFHLFFTLSCAEMRWPEMMAAVLQSKGHKVEFKSDPWNGQEDDILIDDIPLSEFKKTISNMSSFYQDHIVLITLMFDNRVKAFLKSMFGDDIDHYTYRIEWQMRGMPHLHGIIWIKQSKIKELLRSDGTFDLEHPELPAFIDKWTSCSLNHENEEINEIVKDVNVHSHSPSCKKYQTKCRFGFPKLPSPHTIIAKPLPAGKDEKENKERDSRIRKAKNILTKVKNELENLADDSDIELEDLLKKLDIKESDYIDALKISERGSTVILKRKVSERNVNNFNPEFIHAWNGNIDIQACMDPYAVASYLTDYITKSDAGLTRVLKEALKESKDFDDFNRLLYLKQVYMTHRQVSASEAVYRLFRHLQMKCSTVKTIFVSTDFPSERTSFFRNVKDVKNDEDEDFGSDSENEGEGHGQIVSIKGYKGKFKKTESIHTKYSMRPKELEKMCLAQFAITYVPCRKKNVKMTGKISEETSDLCDFISGQELPKYIQLDDGKIMEARNKVLVLRLFSVKNKEGHEVAFASLLLFYPWRNEEKDLKYEDPDECNELYFDNEKLIMENRQKILPYSSFKEDIETKTENDERAAHVYETIDAQNEQENLDDADDLQPIDLSELPKEFDGGEQHSDDVIANTESFKFKPIQFGKEEDMRDKLKSLSFEQRVALDQVIQLCRKKRIERENPSFVVLPELMIVTGMFKTSHKYLKWYLIGIHITGDGGTGKSHFISIASQWAEKFLIHSGDNPNRPKILLLAPTGKAASLIGKLCYNTDIPILHSLISISF